MSIYSHYCQVHRHVHINDSGTQVCVNPQERQCLQRKGVCVGRQLQGLCRLLKLLLWSVLWEGGIQHGRNQKEHIIKTHAPLRHIAVLDSCPKIGA